VTVSFTLPKTSVNLARNSKWVAVPRRLVNAVSLTRPAVVKDFFIFSSRVCAFGLPHRVHPCACAAAPFCETRSSDPCPPSAHSLASLSNRRRLPVLIWPNGSSSNFAMLLRVALLARGKQREWRPRRSTRRLITLIFAGRNRMLMIRRELPRTRNAGWASRACRIKRRGFSLSGTPRPPSALPFSSEKNLVSFVVSPYAAIRCCSASTLTPMAQTKPNSSLPTAVTIWGLFLPRARNFR